MELQEVYETVSRHLFDQGIRALEGSMCCYRGPNNTKCAVGCLIPDEMYDPVMEGKAFQGFIDDAEIYSYNYPSYFYNHQMFLMIQSLQCVHDSARNWAYKKRMQDSLRQVGDRFGLKTVFLDELDWSAQAIKNRSELPQDSLERP